MKGLDLSEPTRVEKREITDEFIKKLKDLDIRVEKTTPVFKISILDDIRTFEIKARTVRDLETAIKKIKESDPFVVYVFCVEETKYPDFEKTEYKICIEVLTK
ncbi:hypothetical protein ZPAH1_orf00033 [Aeromonas phage ZPAH1]|nr:hypothetical protein ZPAH1_orf00033 [Aeromonas phage ZPAH1]